MLCKHNHDVPACWLVLPSCCFANVEKITVPNSPDDCISSSYPHAAWECKALCVLCVSTLSRSSQNALAHQSALFPLPRSAMTNCVECLGVALILFLLACPTCALTCLTCRCLHLLSYSMLQITFSFHPRPAFRPMYMCCTSVHSLYHSEIFRGQCQQQNCSSKVFPNATASHRLVLLDNSILLLSLLGFTVMVGALL